MIVKLQHWKNGTLNLFAYLLAVVLLIPNTATARDTLKEIVVTAQKREENMQDVPIAITVFGGEQMREQSISDMHGISERTPGLLIGTFTPAQPEIAIRGVGTKEDGPGANDSTIISIDDVYVAARIAQVMDIYDLERVEVLRGLQGTLYGRNSIAGSLNFVTEKPDEEFKFRVEQTVGSNENFDTRAMLKGAISEENGLYGKASYSHRIYDGYVDLMNPDVTAKAGIQKNGTQNGIDRHSWRAQLRYAPDDKLDAIFTIDGAHDDDEGLNREPIGDIAIDLTRNSVVINQTLGGAGEPPNSFATEGFLRRDIFGTSLKFEYEFDESMAFTSITAYRDAEVEFALDCCGLNGAVYPRSNYNVVDEEAEQLTQEVRLSGDTDKLNWVAGFFYTDESDHRMEGFVFGEVTNARGSFNAITASTAFSNNSDVDADIEAWAIYGQGTYSVADLIRLTFGLRYSTEEKIVTSSGNITGAGDGIIISPFAATTATSDWDSIDFRVAVDYDLNENVMLYGSIVNGFKSGGFTGSPKTVAVAVTPFDSESA